MIAPATSITCIALTQSLHSSASGTVRSTSSSRAAYAAFQRASVSPVGLSRIRLNVSPIALRSARLSPSAIRSIATFHASSSSGDNDSGSGAGPGGKRSWSEADCHLAIRALRGSSIASVVPDAATRALNSVQRVTPGSSGHLATAASRSSTCPLLTSIGLSLPAVARPRS